MIISYIQPIHRDIDKELLIRKAYDYIKDWKIYIIEQNVSNILNTKFKYTTLKDRITLKYIGVKGSYNVLLDGKPILYFRYTEHKIKDEKIECWLTYKILYKKEGNQDVFNSSIFCRV